eukprot:TRINITY_DN41899_c0_g1_i2.p1 TRINITY_DN41899_c0_g1~~TRINITY_DN41899_c0_g1_i2.p1  ORF type:complete len:397 (-),score=53.74 TRINITY_DN41899_c0_g1_i2:36-1226(-)
MAERQRIVLFLMVCVTLTGTINNFTGRIRAQTLGKYNGVIVGLLNALVYLVFNSIGLALQLWRRGDAIRAQIRIVTRCGSNWSEMGVWKYLVLAAIGDVADDVTGLAAQPYLTTLMYALMNQAIVPFTVLVSMVMLRARYTFLEISSVVVVGVAAILCVRTSHDSAGENNAFWAIFAAVTTSFAAFSFVCKELAFTEYARSCQGKERFEAVGSDSEVSSERPSEESECDSEASQLASEDRSLNIFVVGFGVAAIGLLVVAPISMLNEFLTTREPVLPAMRAGFDCLFECDNALPAYLVAAVVNLAFNLSMLFLTGTGSALLNFLSLKLAVPLVALLSPLPWPIIGPKDVSAMQWILLGAMLAGVAEFRYGNIQKERLSGRVCCWPLCGSQEVKTSS